jgi:hypothetical protein
METPNGKFTKGIAEDSKKNTFASTPFIALGGMKKSDLCPA